MCALGYLSESCTPFPVSASMFSICLLNLVVTLTAIYSTLTIIRSFGVITLLFVDDVMHGIMVIASKDHPQSTILWGYLIGTRPFILKSERRSSSFLTNFILLWCSIMWFRHVSLDKGSCTRQQEEPCWTWRFTFSSLILQCFNLKLASLLTLADLATYIAIVGEGQCKFCWVHIIFLPFDITCRKI